MSITSTREKPEPKENDNTEPKENDNPQPGETVANVAVNSFLDATDEVASAALETFLGNKGEQFAEDPNRVLEETRAEVAEQAEYAAAILKDKDIRENMFKIFSIYTGLAEEIFTKTKPELDSILDMFWETVDESASRGAEGMAKTLNSTIMATLGMIPGIDLLNFAITGAHAAGTLAGTIEPILTNGTEIAKKIESYQEKVKAVIEKNQEKLENATKSYTDATKKFDTAPSIPSLTRAAVGHTTQRFVDEAVSKKSTVNSKSAGPMPGGRGRKKKTRKQRLKKARKTIKRLKKSIQRFTKKNKRKKNSK